ncbi:MAG: DNA polymerase III subunit delta [Ruminococcus sp.]|nr:DNA polymerase III subunit delta [Ruminococcus sp.]
MPVTDPAAVNRSIKNGTPAPLYYFYGHDTASLEAFTKSLINKLCPKDAQFMNFHKFEGKSLDLPALVDACEALPMFADRVVVAINDLKLEDVVKEDAESIKKLLTDLPETTTVIIYSTGVDLYKNKRSLTDKNKRFCDFCAKHGEVIDFAYKTPSELAKSISAALEREGCRIDRRDAEYLAEICLCDSAFIKQELGKLSAYARGREVTREDIDTLCIRHIESDGYDLAVNILNGNARFVFNRIGELAAQNYDAYEIVSIIGFSLTDIYRAKLARASGRTADDAARDFGYPKNRVFAVRKAFQSCGNMSEAHIKGAIRIFSDTDLALKTRSLDKKAAMLVLEQSVAKCFMLGRR